MIQLINSAYQDGMAKIKDGSVDLVLTDPPYGISTKCNLATMGRSGLYFGDWDNFGEMEELYNHLERMTSKNASVVIFNSWKNLSFIIKSLESCGFDFKDMIRWEKPNPMPRNSERRYVVDSEVAVWAVKRGSKWCFNKGDVSYKRPSYKMSAPSKRIHPTEKPIGLIESILAVHSNEGDLIFDPFAGSATTAVACQNLNRNFIGFEREKEYYDKAMQRLADNEIFSQELVCVQK